MVTNSQDDPATLAMLKTMSPMVDDQRYAYEGRDAVVVEGTGSGRGSVRVLADDHDLVRGDLMHTPGPWVAKARPIGGYNIFAEDDVLDDVLVGIAPLQDHALEVARDNARLMAAAPAMKAAIDEADGCFQAAFAEGWIDALADGDIERIRDIWNRRLSYAYMRLPEITP